MWKFVPEQICNKIWYFIKGYGIYTFASPNFCLNSTNAENLLSYNWYVFGATEFWFSNSIECLRLMSRLAEFPLAICWRLEPNIWTGSSENMILHQPLLALFNVNGFKLNIVFYRDKDKWTNHFHNPSIFGRSLINNTNQGIAIYMKQNLFVLERSNL